MRHTLASTLLPENGPTTLSLADRMFVLQVAYAPKTSVALTYLTSSCLPQLPSWAVLKNIVIHKIELLGILPKPPILPLGICNKSVNL